MPLAAKTKAQRQRRDEGGYAAAAIFKVAWLIVLAIFLVSIATTMNMAINATPAPSYREEQLNDRTMKRVDRRAQKISPEAKSVGISSSHRNEHQNSILSSTLSSDEETILKWLRQRDKSNTSNDSAIPSQLLTSPIYFAPGTLPLSQLSTLKHCYADPTIYRQHFKEKSTRRVPYSKKIDLAYVLLPKSGSSTGRFMMKHEFDAVEQKVKLEPPMNVISFVREPLSRFYSQYDEAFVRTAPWKREQNPYYAGADGEYTNKKGTKRKAGGLPHPFPYLHENMHSYKDYQDVFCPKRTRKNPESYRECTFAESREDGTLASRLERFVFDYDGRSPFDIHLTLQVPMLSNVEDGRALHVTELFNTTDAGRDWNAIAKRYWGEEAMFRKAREKKLARTKESHSGVIQGRSYPRRLDVGLVGREAERRICELTLLDYCCLNFPLPKGIREDEEEEGGERSELACKMDYKGGRIRIQPGIFPGVAKK